MHRRRSSRAGPCWTVRDSSEDGSSVAEDETVRGDRRSARGRAVLCAKSLRRSGKQPCHHIVVDGRKRRPATGSELGGLWQPVTGDRRPAEPHGAVHGVLPCPGVAAAGGGAVVRRPGRRRVPRPPVACGGRRRGVARGGSGDPMVARPPDPGSSCLSRRADALHRRRVARRGGGRHRTGGDPRGGLRLSCLPDAGAARRAGLRGRSPRHAVGQAPRPRATGSARCRRT